MENMKEKVRYMMATINNPDEKDSERYKKDNLIDYIERIVKPKFFAFGKEQGKEETVHIHVYMFFTNPRAKSSISKLFNNAHIDKCMGSPAECVAYCHKSDLKFNLKADGTYFYIDSSKKEHSGVHYKDWDYQSSAEIPELKQGKRNDLVDLYSAIESGKSNAEIYRENPNTIRYAGNIDRIRQDILFDKYKEDNRDVKVVMQFGDPGTGKTRWARETFGNANISTISNNKHPFDNYKGQDVIMFEEFYSTDFKVNDMLNWIDIYPLTLPARYSDKMACYHNVIINSNVRIELQYPNVQREYQKTWLAFLRRIHYIRVYEDGIIKTYVNWDEKFSSYFEDDVYVNDFIINAHSTADGCKFDSFKGFDPFDDENIKNFEIIEHTFDK